MDHIRHTRHTVYQAINLQVTALPDDFAGALVRSQTQGSIGKTFGLDAARRFYQVTDANNGSETSRILNHYSNTGDSPSWTASSQDGGNTYDWTRNVIGLDGSLSAGIDSASVSALYLHDLNGSVVATVSNDSAATSPTATYDFTEFGLPRSTAKVRYGWLGGAQRSSDALSGLVLMGVRLYNPMTGRFMQQDPVPGGSANAYDYCAGDPVNARDLDGRRIYNLYFDLGYKRASASRFFTGVRANFGSLFVIPGRAATLDRVGQQMDLHKFGLPFYVTVAALTGSYWRFDTRWPHPDWPGWISFKFRRDNSNGRMNLTVRGSVPWATFCWISFSCEAAWRAYQVTAREVWTPFADQLRGFM